MGFSSAKFWRFGLVFASLASLVGCDTAEDVDIVADCISDILPPKTQCMLLNGVDLPFRYDEEALYGSWSNEELESCTVYRSDGTGTVHHWGMVDSLAQRESSEILWGVGLNVDGTDVIQNNAKYVYHLDVTGSLLDSRMWLLRYTVEEGVSLGYERVESCPQAVVRDQGAITFYTTNAVAGPTSIEVDGLPAGVLRTSIGSDAEAVCGSDVRGPFLTVYRQPGIYSITASSQHFVWDPLDLTVDRGSCQLVPFL